MEDPKTFTVTVPVTHTFREGFGVFVDPIYDFDDASPTTYEDLNISDIAVTVVPIREELVTIVGGVPCVPIAGSGFYVPVENFPELPDLTVGDTHDLRSRWFATEEEAQAHATFTRERWENPAPWESFIAL